MNPCFNCPFNEQECHEIGFDAKCDAWIAWKTNWIIFKAEVKQRNEILKLGTECVKEMSLAP